MVTAVEEKKRASHPRHYTWKMIGRSPEQRLPQRRWFKHSAFLYAVLSFLAFLPCLLSNQFYDGGDIPTFAVWRDFLRENLRQGQFPLWNPYYLGGSPFSAHPDTMSFYPFLYP